MLMLTKKQTFAVLLIAGKMSRILQEGQRSWSAWGKLVLVKDTAAGQTGIWTCAPQAEGSDSRKHEGELWIVRTERRVLSFCVCPCFCLSVSLNDSELCRRFLAPRGWRLECCHNRCCLTRPIIICYTAVCPYPLFLLPLIPLYILLHLLRLFHHIQYISSSRSAVIQLHLQTFTFYFNSLAELFNKLPLNK